MWWMERVERLDRRWTVDDSGCHVQFGDLLEDIVDEVQANYGLFTLEEVSEKLVAKLDPVLTKANGEYDRKTVNVVDVRKALEEAGL